MSGELPKFLCVFFLASWVVESESSGSRRSERWVFVSKGDEIVCGMIWGRSEKGYTLLDIF